MTAATKTRFFYAVDYFPMEYGRDPEIKAFRSVKERDAWVNQEKCRFAKSAAIADDLVKRYLFQNETAREAALRGMI